MKKMDVHKIISFCMRHKAQGNLGHSASPSLGHYATLSFVVVGDSIKDGARKPASPSW